MTAASEEQKASWIDRALGFLSAALPFGLALTRAASTGQWRDDLPAVRDLGLVAVGVGGGLSTFVAQALSLIPLGSRTFRAALGAALALALAAHLLYQMSRGLLARAGAPPRLGAALAAVATLTAALSPTWQREATVGGGAMLATAVTLAALALAIEHATPPPDHMAFAPQLGARAWIVLGALLGAAFAESPPAGVAALAAVAVLLLQRWVLDTLQQRRAQSSGRASRAPVARRPSAPPLPTGRTALLTILAALLVAALFLAPLALRPLAPRAWADIGRALSASSVAAVDVIGARPTALATWAREVGVISLCIAAAGSILALLRPRTRELLAPFAVLLALDTLLPARASSALAADPLAAIRTLAVASIALGSALGVAEIVSLLLRARVPMATSGSVLLVVFHITLIALTSEEAGHTSDRSEQLAAEVWTDEALGRLEPRSAILVRSPAVAWRLWAARLVRGERPDIVVIPIPLLNRGRVAASLLASDRSLEPLLRSYALTGEPSEFALSSVADVRPLHVELDRRWSRRIVTHLGVDGMWLEYAPQPLGPSDRKLAATAQTPLKRVLAAIGEADVPDVSTSGVVAETLIGQASVLSAVGDHEAAQALFDRAGALIPPGTPAPMGSLRAVLGGLRRAMVGREPEPRSR